MKIVGVRPISKHYFSLYCQELQELRVKVKPGLLPPFYADMPKTLDEIQASEMKYLRSCEKNGSFFTDLSYLWKIIVNILFKKARSN
jgi:lipopolysaccharide/colanic/teichoic acid biosynthesis glycosyltransferase